MKEYMQESELAAQVIGWLQQQHWTVYPEVRPQLGGPRADIVAIQAGRIWVIECKLRFGLAVIAQAADWRPWAHWVSIATPRKWRPRRVESPLKQQILQWKGIGHLRVCPRDGVRVAVRPKLHRKARVDLITESLTAAHVKMGIAGSRNDYYTPYRATCRQLLEYVRANPGCSMRDAIVSIQHHYKKDSTAMSCLHKWIRLGKVPGVERRGDGWQLLLFPTGETA